MNKTLSHQLLRDQDWDNMSRIDSKEFHPKLKDTASSLRNDINDATDNEQVKGIRRRLLLLRDTVQDAIADLATYDRKVYIDMITSLTKQLEERNIQLRRSKFSFKSTSSLTGKSFNSEMPKDEIKQNSELLQEPYIDNITSSKLTIDIFIEHSLLQNIAWSIISTRVSSGSTHLKNISYSIIDILTDGPAFVQDMTNTIFIVSCRQLRLHNVTNSIILAKVQNDKAVIENCNGLKIGKYPSDDVTIVEIDDFNWPTKQKKNTHFQYLAETVDITWSRQVTDGQLDKSMLDMMEKLFVI